MATELLTRYRRRADDFDLLRLLRLTVILAVGLLLASGCSNNPSLADRLADVRFWAYQIQKQDEGNNIQELADSHYDLLVIDHTRSIKDEQNYDSKTDVELLKNSQNSTGGKKIVICYIDIGEAESYRWYWQTGWQVGNPEWVVAPDPDGWDENYPVKFWCQEWKDIMKQSFDWIIADGYDGVYLDWLEVYSFEPVAHAAQAEGLDPRQELYQFVKELRDQAHSQKSDFIFIAQNAAELADFPEYVELFDAIAQEAVWFDGAGDPDSSGQPGDVPGDSLVSLELINDLKDWQAQNRIAFNVEYAQESTNVEQAYQLGKGNGFKTYVTLRPLDALTKTPPSGN